MSRTLLQHAGQGGLKRCDAMRKSENGQGMVETALALLGAFTLAMMLCEGSMLVYAYTAINGAAREGVRYAVVHGSDSTNCSGPSPGCADAPAANVVAVVKQYAALSFHDISNMTITVDYPEATQADPLSLVTVTIKYTYVPLVKLFNLNSTLTITSHGRIVY